MTPTERDSTYGPLENPGVSHEKSDLSIAAVFGFMALLLVSGFVIHVLTGLFFLDLRGPGAARAGTLTPFVTGPGAPPPRPAFRGLGAAGLPVQQVSPRAEREDLDRHERDTLRAWGWQETPFGPTVPVARALDALAADGQPVEREVR